MSDADEAFPNPPDQVILAGDHTDDDGTIIAELTQENPWPPTAEQLPTTPIVPLVAVRPRSRLLTYTTTVRASQNGVMILQPDVDRIHLYIRVDAPATNPGTYIRIADDLSKVQMDMGSANLVSTAFLTLDDFNGPIYAMVPIGDGAKDYGMTVTIVGTTR